MWEHVIKIKQFLTKDSDYDSVQKSMNAIADVLERDAAFALFGDTIKEFRMIDKENSMQHANRLLNDLYDFADKHEIWIL